ncbi:MAG: PhzF family phenazine biosynthesis protein [Ignavibacteriaceae bacterium]
MAKKISIYQVDAFTKKVFGGNPAGVTCGNGLTEIEKQSIAREMNLAETAFLSDSDKADYKLQWFTPATEVKLCGHATIASLHFLNEQELLLGSSIKFETLSGVLNCGMRDGNYFMQIPVFNAEEFTGNKEEIINALGIPGTALDEKVPFILLENGYLYIYVKTLKDLKNINPDFKALKSLSVNKRGFEDVSVFTLETFDENSFAHLRFFAPYYGIDEDPVTGSSNGPLMLVLQKLGFVQKSDSEITLTFEQGDFMNRRGRVMVSYNEKKNELYISGNAVTVIKGELFLSSDIND